MKQILFFLLTCIQACLHAEVFIYNIDTSYGTDKTSGKAPWATVTFQDTASNHVQMIIAVSSNPSSQSISQLNFNFDPKQTELLNSLKISNEKGITPDTIYKPSADTYSAGISKDYDFRIDFQTTGKNRLTGGTISYFDITGENLTASMFNFTNSKEQDPFIVAVNLQNRETDFWAGAEDISIPEPSTYLLLATLLFIVIFIRKRHLPYLYKQAK